MPLIEDSAIAFDDRSHWAMNYDATHWSRNHAVTSHHLPPEQNMYSANGVPWPLDNYLRLIGQPTTDDMVKYLIKWGK